MKDIIYVFGLCQGHVEGLNVVLDGIRLESLNAVWSHLNGEIFTIVVKIGPRVVERFPEVGEDV